MGHGRIHPSAAAITVVDAADDGGTSAAVGAGDRMAGAVESVDSELTACGPVQVIHEVLTASQVRADASMLEECSRMLDAAKVMTD